jgi:hypothetical protein
MSPPSMSLEQPVRGFRRSVFLEDPSSVQCGEPRGVIVRFSSEISVFAVSGQFVVGRARQCSESHINVQSNCE